MKCCVCLTKCLLKPPLYLPCLLVCAGEMEVVQSPETVVSVRDPVLSQPVHCEWACVLVFCSCEALQGTWAAAVGVVSCSISSEVSHLLSPCSLCVVRCPLQRTRQQTGCRQRQSYLGACGAYSSTDSVVLPKQPPKWGGSYSRWPAQVEWDSRWPLYLAGPPWCNEVCLYLTTTLHEACARAPSKHAVWVGYLSSDMLWSMEYDVWHISPHVHVWLYFLIPCR